MSSSLEIFCQEICSYFEINHDDNMLISLIIRDIYLNDIIYLEPFDKWKEYASKKKTWEDFNMDFEKKIMKVSTIFEKLIDHLINIDYENDKKKRVIIHILKISKFIHSKKYDVQRILNNCKLLFSVNYKNHE
jgi:hypothetical protein